MSSVNSQRSKLTQRGALAAALSAEMNAFDMIDRHYVCNFIIFLGELLG
jgi:hypothetical protein